LTIGQFITRFGVLTSHPAAFLVVIVYVGLWLLLSPGTFDWQAVATLATWMMTLLIQRAEHRDTQAIHAKLDELLRAQDSARSEFAGLDSKEPEEIVQHRKDESAKVLGG
jgi:low affinity Fe/Cu permease